MPPHGRGTRRPVLRFRARSAAPSSRIARLWLPPHIAPRLTPPHRPTAVRRSARRPARGVVGEVCGPCRRAVKPHASKNHPTPPHTAPAPYWSPRSGGSAMPCSMRYLGGFLKPYTTYSVYIECSFLKHSKVQAFWLSARSCRNPHFVPQISTKSRRCVALWGIVG